MKLNNIIIGTANFGLKYGLKKKKFSNLQKLTRIINQAKKLKKKICFDTAEVYGLSKKTLGKYFNQDNVEVIFKVTLKKKENLNYKNFKKRIIKSITAAGIKKLYCLMIHNIEILKSKNQLKLVNDNLEKLKKEKFIKKKGISIYETKSLKKIYNTFDPDIIQLPSNIFDQRFIKSIWFKKLKNDKKEIHLRSIFLQGLLLEKKIPKKFLNFKSEFNKWFDWLDKNNCTNFEGCLNFILNQKIKSKIVIGIDNYDHYKQILNFRINKNLKYKYLSSNKLNLIDPRRWS